MTRLHTHYDNLKVTRNAPPEVIRAAYRTLSKKYHPDHNPDNPDAMRIIQMINAAYEVLSDPEKRVGHDKWILMTEAKDAIGTINSNVPSNHTYRHAKGNRRRKTSCSIRKPQNKVTATMLCAVHKLWLKVGYFSKYLFKKA